MGAQCLHVHSPTARGVESPAAGLLPKPGVPGKPGDAEHHLLPPPHAPRWERWQTPAQVSRQTLSSDRISAKYSQKVKIICKEATELSSPSWWENPPLTSASLFQALQTKPELSFPSPCPNNPQCCWHTHTRIRTGTRPAARPQQNPPGGCCWSPQFLPGSRCSPLHTDRVLLETKAQTHPERCLCSPAQPDQHQHPRSAPGAAVYVFPARAGRKQAGAGMGWEGWDGMGCSSAPRRAGICRRPAGWRRARARLHFPAGIAQDRGHLGLASDTAAVTLRRGLGAVPASGVPSECGG